MAETGDGKKEDADYKRLQSFPLIRHTDMPEEMRVETMELCVTACEKFASNNESAAKMIKESMDKKFGSSWHVVIGEGFGFEVSHEVRNLLYMFFGGSLAVVVGVCLPCEAVEDRMCVVALHFMCHFKNASPFSVFLSFSLSLSLCLFPVQQCLSIRGLLCHLFQIPLSISLFIIFFNPFIVIPGILCSVPFLSLCNQH
ncbi:Dynein axonemal light chain 4 [Labeo rohita]|uniref:Dynein axonemal light chain 4 n=1 Tax=Labeo rohita TaxID=84645 RepID=A0ABQ8MUI6_LABRO|nr:Dynein axonemal light chain 4 [Labeo rohita]